MNVLIPKQFQRRKLLVVLIISTPLLTRFPHNEHDNQHEERQARLAFHRRPRLAINYNTIDNFRELTQAIDEMEKQAEPRTGRAKKPPMQTHRPTRNPAPIITSSDNFTMMHKLLLQHWTSSDVGVTEAGGSDIGTRSGSSVHAFTHHRLPPPLSRKARKRVIHDSDDDGENIVVVKRTKTQDQYPVGRSEHLKTPPPSIVGTPKLITPRLWPVDEPKGPRKHEPERIDDTGTRTYSITFEPLTTDGDVEQQLEVLLRKYQASLIMRMTDLEQDLLGELETSKVMTFEVFRNFKEMCLNRKWDTFVQPQSSLDAWVMRRQARYLFDLTGGPVKPE